LKVGSSPSRFACHNHCLNQSEEYWQCPEPRTDWACDIDCDRPRPHGWCRMK
jgi:hypothetical protein